MLARFLLFALLFSSAGLLLYRGVCDFYLIYQGDVIVVQSESSDGYDYLLRIPKGYNDFSGPQPLLIYLHGAGDRGTDPMTLVDKDPVAFSRKEYRNRETAEFPFIVATPICPEKRWEPSRIIIMLDEILASTRFRYQIDPNRIYLTGYSMGGFGTYETAMAYPERFAAIVPVAGGGEPDKAEKLKDVAIWAFHGALDETVPLPSTQLVVEAMQNMDHKHVQMSVMAQQGHDIAEEVYRDKTLYRWLLRHRR
ncbi:MAG: prolyl oligopeptidase family serine peptidase [Planctomycetia bacterium]|nr:prolyl oligopeptidase family serine peptidase [Planctomycetia bacterium]